ncbi:MAG: hypothetical protein WKG00_10085 [Polyangiaceae bacterium]
MDLRSATCGARLAVGEGGLALLGHADDHPDATYVGASPLADPAALTVRAFTSDQLGLGPRGFVPRIAVGGDEVFLESSEPSSPAAVDLRDGSRRGDRSAPAAELVEAIPGGAVAIATDDETGVLVLRGGGSVAGVLRPARWRSVTALAVDRAGPSSIAWVESEPSGGGYQRSVLWSSPLPLDHPGAERRRDASFDDELASGGAGLVANRGVALVLAGPTTAWMIRLSDGATWRVEAEPGEGFVTPLWIDEDAVWLSAAPLGPSFSAHEADIVRIGREAWAPRT